MKKSSIKSGAIIGHGPAALVLGLIVLTTSVERIR